MNIITRSQWGSVTKDGKPFPVPSAPKMSLPARELWIHHTVTNPTKDPKADARTVQRVAYSRGFTDISYSYLIHPDGTVLEGRGLHVGAHTKERNSFALAFSFIGNYSELEPTNAQMESARVLRANLIGAGALRPDHPLKGHRQNPASPSECPGNKLYPRIGEILRPARAPAPAPSPEEDNMYAIPFDLAPGEDVRLSVEPALNGFFSNTKSLLLLDALNGDGDQKVWVWHQFTQGGEVIVKAGTRYTRNLDGGWVHVRNDGTRRVFGSLLVKKV